MKKALALLLALTLCLGLLTGCKDKGPDLSVPMDIDPATAYAKYAPDDVVMTIDGSEVTWNEFFYRLYSVVYQIKYYSEDGLMHWNDPCIADETLTNLEYAWKNAVDTCVQYHALDSHFTELDVVITPEDEAALAELMQSDIKQFCGEDGTEEDFNAVLEEMYMTRETYDFINRVAQLYDRAYGTMFGKNGEQLSDEEIASFVADREYITAKHILIKTVDEMDQPLTGDGLAEKLARATLLLARLQEVEDDRDALLALFDELMAEYSEDTGLADYPDGYTFAPGEMVNEFRSGAEALADYEISDLIKSQFGYHIILRLPTTRDSVVDFIDGENDYTVGTYAAAEAFGNLMDSWTGAADIQWSKAFKNLTAADIFYDPDAPVPTASPEPTPTPTPEA